MANQKRWHLEIRDNETGETKVEEDVSILIYAAKSGDDLKRGTVCIDSRRNMKIIMEAMLEELEFNAEKLAKS